MWQAEIWYYIRMENNYSAKWKKRGTRQGLLRNALLKTMGYTDEDIEKPLIGIVNTWSETNPGHYNFRMLSDAVKRLALETGLGAKIYADKIPFEGNSFQLGRELDLDPVSAAMNGGEDCRLLFAVPILSLEKFRRDFQTFDIIGHLAQPEAGTVLVTPDGAELPLRAPGWPEDA